MKKTLPILTTDRLRLRPITDADLENIHRGLSHPQVIAYYGVSFSSLEATKEQMAWYAAPEQYWWAICAPDGREFYGAGGLNDVSPTERKAEIGLWLLPDHWGRGIMGEVLPLICDFGWNELGLRRIEGFVETENSKCKAAMRKLDFRHEATLADCEEKDGQRISVDVFVKTRAE